MIQKNYRLLLVFIAFTLAFFSLSYFSEENVALPQEAEIGKAFQAEEIQTNLLPVSSGLIEPVDGFRQRITKKPFSIYITPETSPIQPDKFKGYHTGADAEYGDVEGDVAVRAVADGTILFQDWVSGYGGVMVIRHSFGPNRIIALYGHLDHERFLFPTSVNVKAGDHIGFLGDGYSRETDGARKHLHFSIRPDKDEKINFRGYVAAEEELADWLNPMDFYN